MSPSIRSELLFPSPSTLTASAPIRVFRRVRDALPEGRAIAEDVWQARHRAMVWLLWLHVAVIAVYAILTGKTIAHSIFEASIVAAAAALARWGSRDRRFRSVAATFGLTASSAILVHLSGGVVELHFHYFFTLAVVSLYHDWAPFLVAIAFVTIQHGVSGILDPHSVYNHADALAHPWKWAAIHAGFVLATSIVSLVRWKSSEIEALKDPLTRLPNRALFGDRLRQALSRRTSCSTVAVLFLDVDDFKSINDTAGHAAGDRLLIVVAERLREAVRPADTVARLGGDEFAIVLEGVSVDDATEIASRILGSLQVPLVFDGRRFGMGASIGIAMVDSDITQSELVRNADIAMYVAKNTGKDRYAVFEASMHRDVMERADLAKALSGALDRDEIAVAYQPVVALSDQRILGFEALVRWEHPRRGTIGPLRFIPLAEETGDIVGLGRWILREACADAKAWADRYPSHPPRWMSVNMSARQLAEADFINDVIGALRDSGLPPELLTLELTETAMMGDDPAILSQLHHLKALGVKIALDDFGTGYSSLGYLRRLPIDVLKIDKTFVDGIDQGPEDAALAKAVLKIAESMGLSCIAEGVERDMQASELNAAGCEVAQGFLYSQPVEPERIEAMLLSHPGRWTARGRVMVVEASGPARDLICTKLQAARFSITIAGSVREAMDRLRKGRVDLVVLSSTLPDMRGVDLATQIRSEDCLAHLPIMFLASGSAGDAISETRFGDRFRPVPPDELLRTVEMLLPAIPA